MIRVLVNPSHTGAVSFSWNANDPQIVGCTYCNSFGSDGLQVLIEGNPNDPGPGYLHGKQQRVASIGTAEATPFGREDARKIWEVLVRTGWVVVDEISAGYIFDEHGTPHGTWNPEEMRFRGFLLQRITT